MPLAFMALCLAAIFDGSYFIAGTSLVIFVVLLLLERQR
jgi:hypothetical protein